MSVLDTIIPPEIHNDALYELISRLCRDEPLHNVLEIGASSGAGSTEALALGLSSNPASPSLHCIEVSSARHQLLSKRYSGLSWVYCHNYSSVPIESFPAEQDVIDFYQQVPTSLNHYPLETVLAWLREDKEYIVSESVAQNGIEKIRNEFGVERFDLVLIDGSEFTGSAELDLLYGSGIIVLDDVNAYKNFANCKRLMADPAYDCIACDRNLRNGFAAFRLKKSDSLIHFFTIVLNGMPFIRHHVGQFRHLPFRWHWHVVEGAAELLHDTAWSLPGGGSLPESSHRNGLSIDGTTEYLDALRKEYPDNVTIYRKPSGQLWQGKLEMVNAPLEKIKEPCLLWQIDADECWTRLQLFDAWQMFHDAPERSAAYYWCHFFVGRSLVVASRNCYSQQGGQEWLRTWRFEPGDRWLAYEPPHLIRRMSDGAGQDVARINPFTNDETEARGLVFQHFAYVAIEQLRFKEKYYGYAGATWSWLQLQKETQFPQLLRNYLPWVHDASVVDRIDGRGLLSILPSLFASSTGPDSSAVVIDLVFFQYFSTGIARVWSWLLDAIADTSLARRIVLLDRDGTAPVISGYRTIRLPRHVEDSRADRELLESVCRQLGARLFLSTWHSSPIDTPAILMIHDMLPEILLGEQRMQEARWREKATAIRQASAYISVSQNSARDLVKFCPETADKPVHVIHNGIPASFRPAAAADIESFRRRHGIDKPYYLYVGPRGWYKNFMALLNAFALLPNRRDYLIVCTSGEPMEQEFAGHPALASVLSAGRLSDHELVAAYSGATALVYPSSLEGFGLPPIEAMACGCPVIVGDAPAVAEVTGGAARNVVPSDARDFVDALLEVQQLQRREFWIQRGRLRAALFGLEAQAQQFIEIVER